MDADECSDLHVLCSDFSYHTNQELENALCGRSFYFEVKDLKQELRFIGSLTDEALLDIAWYEKNIKRLGYFVQEGCYRDGDIADLMHWQELKRRAELRKHKLEERKLLIQRILRTKII